MTKFVPGIAAASIRLIAILLLMTGCGLQTPAPSGLGACVTNPRQLVKQPKILSKKLSVDLHNFLNKEKGKDPQELHYQPSLSHQSVTDQINAGIRRFDCDWPPYAISRDAEIIPYPSLNPHPSLRKMPACTDFSSNSDSPSYPDTDSGLRQVEDDRLKSEVLAALNSDLVQDKKDSQLKSDILTMAGYVGKLEVKLKVAADGSDDSDDSKGVKYEFWGTGFRIAPRIVATSCHSIESFLPDRKAKNKKLKLDPQSSFDIHFEGKTERRCEITTLLGCSQKEGVDLALLQIDSCKGTVPGNPTTDDGFTTLAPLSTVDPGKLSIIAIIGYGDLFHPVDEDTEELFAPYRGKYDKFLSLGEVAGVDECNPSHRIIADLASTTVGESGGILISVEDGKLKIAGVHTCCSTFFDGSGNNQPMAETDCAMLQRTYANQAVSIRDIFQDPDLCSALPPDVVASKCPTASSIRKPSWFPFHQ